MTSKMDTREFDRLSREIEKSGPSAMAREIARRNSEKETTREALENAARDMGITASELASDIIAERTFIAENNVPAKGSKEFEAGMNLVESRERRSLVKAIAIAERATRPDYKVARELLESVGNEKGIVVSSMPNGEIAVFGTYRAIDPEYARAMAEKAIAGVEKVSARIEDAEKAIENAPLKKATPAMKKELADAEKAMQIARARMQKANVRLENSKAISADGIRLEEKARLDWYEMRRIALFGEKTIESWELPNAIVRRPFRHFIRINSDRKNYSSVENEVIRNEIEAEKAIVRAMVAEFVATRIAEKAEKEKADAETKRAETNAAYKMREAERKRNARKAKRNAR